MRKLLLAALLCASSIALAQSTDWSAPTTVWTRDAQLGGFSGSIVATDIITVAPGEVAITITVAGEVTIDWRLCERYAASGHHDVTYAACTVALAVRDGKAVSK